MADANIVESASLDRGPSGSVWVPLTITAPGVGPSMPLRTFREFVPARPFCVGPSKKASGKGARRNPREKLLVCRPGRGSRQGVEEEYSTSRSFTMRHVSGY
jgi:hypothetical protein